MKTASSHNEPLTGRVGLPWTERVPMLSINPHAGTPEDIARLSAELMEAYSSLSRAQERLEEVKDEVICLTEKNSLLESKLTDSIGRENFWFDIVNERFPDEVQAILKSHRLATEDTKPEQTPPNDDPVKPASYELLEAAMRLIAEPWRQSDYTPQQLARHVLRIEPLPERPATEDKPEKE